MALRPAEGEREMVESVAGAGGPTAKDTKRADGVCILGDRGNFDSDHGGDCVEDQGDC